MEAQRRVLIRIETPELGTYEVECPLNASMQRVAGMMAQAVSMMSIRYDDNARNFLRDVAAELVDRMIEDVE